MNNIERLMAFFEAENKRDWEKYRQFLHPNVRYFMQRRYK